MKFIVCIGYQHFLFEVSACKYHTFVIKAPFERLHSLFFLEQRIYFLLNRNLLLEDLLVLDVYLIKDIE